MNPIAKELNERIKGANPHIHEMLSGKGKELYFPRGILSQSAEAKENAYKFNATIGIATELGQPMHLPSIMSYINLPPGKSLSYAPSFGIPELRKVWLEHMIRKNPTLKGKQLSLPNITNAITHGLSVTADMWIDNEDVILLPDKIWGNYNLVLKVLHGARFSQYALFSSDGGFNLGGFEDALNKEAKENEKLTVLFNFPNNPTGYTPTTDEGGKIVEILKKVADKEKNILAIVDDAYFGLFYDDISMKESIFSAIAGVHPRIMAIKLDGATKENYAWGLRVGFITYGASFSADSAEAHDALERKTAGAVRGSISNSPHLSQSIVLGSLNSGSYDEEKRGKFQVMQARAGEVKKVLKKGKYRDAWDVYPFNSGYFMCLRLKTVDAEQLRLHLLDRYGVGLISLGETDIRIAFSCVEKEDIQELFDIILQGVKDLEKSSG